MLLITPRRHADERGVLTDVYRADVLAAPGLAERCVQGNLVCCHQCGVLSGLRFQAPPHAQGKLVRCARGSIWNVVVDIRAGSPCYGRHVAAALSAETSRLMWIPAGFSDGYLTLEAGCEVVYQPTD